jgi:queuine/archaeosine tRNA-ribosyltransferase
MLQGLEIYPYLLSDSGGFQIFQRLSKIISGETTEKFDIIPGVGIHMRNGILIIDPIDLCEKYGILDVRCGFTIDFPMVEASKEEYKNHLIQSYECAVMMFDCCQDSCPDTQLFIPLHFRTKEQLHRYFKKMSTLSPDGYAFPVRDDTSLEYLMKIAYALSFLHAKGIQHVHMFGSCKPEIIVIGAAAIGLEMFQRITFDSSTWDTARNNPPKLLEPNALKQIDIRKLEVYRPMLPKPLTQKLKGYEQYLPRSYFYKLILLNNVLNVNRLTQKMTEMAEDIEQLKWFIKISADYEPVSDMLMHAIGLLQKARKKGYDYIEKEFEFIWY